MKAPVEIKVVIEQGDAEKLLELAGGESLLPQYLMDVIDRLYKEHQILGDEPSFARLINVAQSMADQNKTYKEAIRILRRSLKKLMKSQAQLIAQANLVHDTSPRTSTRRTLD